MFIYKHVLNTTQELDLIYRTNTVGLATSTTSITTTTTTTEHRLDDGGSKHLRNVGQFLPDYSEDRRLPR
jgi:hypothetical protein